jgi:hypothetical protein
MMIHLQLLLPDHFAANLWSFALSYAMWLHNHTPTEDLGFSPIELFSGIHLNYHHLGRVRVFGCPTYVCQRDDSTVRRKYVARHPNLLYK